MLREIAGLGIVGVLLAGIIAAIHAVGLKHAVRPELKRKLVHMGMGTLCCFFPWIFHHWFTVVFLAVAAVTGLLLLRRTPLAHVLFSVKRQSVGDLCFPVSVCLLFAAAGDQPVLYVVPVMILTFADSAAALVGASGGQTYSTGAALKTWEGSMAFWVVAFAAVFLPVAALTGAGAFKASLCAIMIATAAMVFEAIALNGRDNIYIPLGAFLFLSRYLELDESALVLRLAGLALSLILVVLLRKRTTLVESALMAAGLIAYGVLILQGIVWLLVPLVFVMIYRRLFPDPYEGMLHQHDTHALTSAASAGLLCLFFAFAAPSVDFGMAWLIAWMVQLAIAGAACLGHAGIDSARAIVLRASLTASVVLLAFVPLLAPRALVVPFLFLAPALTGLGCGLFVLTEKTMEKVPHTTERWIRQGLSAVIASSIAVVVCIVAGGA